MKYYIIHGEQIYTAENQNAFADLGYTEEVHILPDDYNSEKYIVVDGELVLNPNYEKEQEEKEKERVNNLTMTALDFIGVLQCFGLSLQQINDYLESHLELKMQLTYCQNVYCGVVKKLCPLTVAGIEITVQMIEIAFKNKHGEN